MASKKKPEPKHVAEDRAVVADVATEAVPPTPRCETCVFLHRGVACTVCGAKRAK